MGALLLVGGCVLVAAAALLPLRRALFAAAAMLAMVGYAGRRMFDNGSLVALSPLSAACAFLVVLLVGHLA
ncbi:MAG: hypothetical protein DLM59_19615, partial [Pseudonocardiales bacterium]